MRDVSLAAPRPTALPKGLGGPVAPSSGGGRLGRELSIASRAVQRRRLEAWERHLCELSPLLTLVGVSQIRFVGKCLSLSASSSPNSGLECHFPERPLTKTHTFSPITLFVFFTALTTSVVLYIRFLVWPVP